MLPLGFASLSFREGQVGDIRNVTTTRNPAIQGWDLEVTGLAVGSLGATFGIANVEAVSEVLGELIAEVYAALEGPEWLMEIQRKFLQPDLSVK